MEHFIELKYEPLSNWYLKYFQSGVLRIDTNTLDGRIVTLSRVESDRLFAGSSLADCTAVAESGFLCL